MYHVPPICIRNHAVMQHTRVIAFSFCTYSAHGICAVFHVSNIRCCKRECSASYKIMDILKIGCIITAVFCLHAESQNCSSTYTCPGTRGDARQNKIECDKLCDFISDCSDADGADEAQCGTLCTFEDGTCNWEATSSNSYTWALGSGELLTDQSHLGPAQDKSAGNSTGGYFYVREEGSGTAALAELHGPTLHNTAETCKFSFYYHFSESDAWHLQVLLKTNYSTRQIKDIGSSSTGSRLWRKKYITLGRVAGSGNVIFRASKLPGATGAVAIDYINFVADSCALAYDGTCASNEWECDGGGCIPQEKRCDFVQHCRDNSDETHPDCADKNRCDAEVDFCDFTSSGDAVWQRVLASSVPADSNWPVIDHTSMTPEGSYFAVNGSSGGTRAVFLGPAFKGTTQGEAVCEMSLFYQLVGVSSSVEFGFRTMYSRADSTPLRVANSRVKAWKNKDFTFESSTDFLPLLVVELEEGGVFATDDIIFSEGCMYAEPEVISDRCTFEDENMPLCSWQQDNAGLLQWEVTEAIKAGRMGAIKVDHTDQDFTGHYLYLDSKKGDEGHSARLFSKLFQPGNCQMILWYHLGGSNTNKLSVYTRTAATEGALQLKWRESGDHGRTWNEAVIPINQTSIFQIVIEGSAGTFTTRMDHIGVDDIGFNIPCVAAGEGVTLPSDVEDEGDCSDVEYSCTDGTCTLDEQGKCPMECTFDEGLCGWKNVVTAGSQWSLSETIPAYGPTSDRTSQGQYLFIDGKDNAPYQAAQLVSPRWPLSDLDCKVFIWYYHFASNYGSLALQVKPNQGITREVYILHSHKSDFNRWTRIEADIPKCLSNFQILLTAQNSYGNLQHGGFAVDDFSLTCSQPTCTPEYQCSTGEHCFTPSQKCDMMVDCCDDRTDEDQCDDYNQCSFDDNFCIWHQDPDDEIEWTLKPEKRKRDAHTDDGIPPNDGSFIQAEFEDSMKGKKSTLHSYLMSSTDDKCELRFVYYTESSTSLRVLLRHSLGEEDGEQVWTSSMSGSWQRAVVSLPTDEPFEVVFEASSVSIEGGVTGIDSTSFTPSCDITDENLKSESKGSGLTAVIIFVVGILVCCALLIVLVIALKSRKKDYHTGESGSPTKNPEEASSMI